MTDLSVIENRARNLTSWINAEIETACGKAAMWMWEGIADDTARRLLPPEFEYRMLTGIGVVPRIGITRYRPD